MYSPAFDNHDYFPIMDNSTAASGGSGTGTGEGAGKDKGVDKTEKSDSSKTKPQAVSHYVVHRSTSESVDNLEMDAPREVMSRTEYYDHNKASTNSVTAVHSDQSQKTYDTFARGGFVSERLTTKKTTSGSDITSDSSTPILVSEKAMSEPRGRDPLICYCTHCQTEVETIVVIHKKTQAYIAFLVLLLLFLWPFCLIPLLLKRCDQPTHYCTSCGRKISGKKSQMEITYSRSMDKSMEDSFVADQTK